MHLNLSTVLPHNYNSYATLFPKILCGSYSLNCYHVSSIIEYRNYLDLYHYNIIANEKAA